jgi:hypothetical protein
LNCLGSRAEPGFYFFLEDFLRGTLPPSFLASDNPIAIACFLLVTFLPEPLLSVPFFFSCIAFSTFSEAFFPYLAIARIPPWNRLHYFFRVSAAFFAERDREAAERFFAAL